MFVCILYVVNLVFINQMDRVMLIRGKYTLVQKSNYFIYISFKMFIVYTKSSDISFIIKIQNLKKQYIYVVWGGE